jgi:hypothetical protein
MHWDSHKDVFHILRMAISFHPVRFAVGKIGILRIDVLPCNLGMNRILDTFYQSEYIYILCIAALRQDSAYHPASHLIRIPMGRNFL